MPIVFRRGVGRDLADAYGWYEEQHPGLGEEFLASVDASFDFIAKFPGMFARRAMRALSFAGSFKVVVQAMASRW